MEKPTAFVVEDFQPLRHSLVIMLERASIPCESFGCANEFIDTFDINRPGCLVLDLQLPEMTGLQLHSLTVNRGCKVPFLIMSGNGSIGDATEAMRNGAVDFLQKPFPPGLLLDRINEAFRKDSLQREKWIQQEETRKRLATLTDREEIVLNLLEQLRPHRHELVLLLYQGKSARVVVDGVNVICHSGVGSAHRRGPGTCAYLQERGS